MELKTKYNIGDAVYFMSGGIPLKLPIAGITIFSGFKHNARGIRCSTAAGEYSVKYNFTEILLSVSEQSAYATKEELIKSLFDKL